MTPEEKMFMAARLRAIADSLLVPTSMLTGLPPEMVTGFVEKTSVGAVELGKKKKKRKTSAYNRRYKAAFKRLAPKYKLKNGNWKKNGFRSAVKAAHKVAGGKKK